MTIRETYKKASIYLIKTYHKKRKGIKALIDFVWGLLVGSQMCHEQLSQVGVQFISKSKMRIKSKDL